MENRRQWSDAALLAAIAGRDGAAFAVFYRRHLPTVLAFLIREMRDREAAADLAATADTGSTWTQVTVPGVVQWAYLGFTDATHGVGLGYVASVSPANERLYYTTDAGHSYHLVPLR